MFKRVCSFILTLIILISCNLNVFEINGEEQQVTLVQIPIFSNEIDEKYLTGYLFNNSEYFVSIDDICRLTRSTYEISDNKITIRRGIEYVTLDIKDNTITLEGKNVECKIRKYNETYLLKPYSMLKFLGAYCDYLEEDNVFVIIMHEFTVFEAIDFNLYNNVHYNIANEEISTFLIMSGSNIFMDLLSRGTGMISFAFTKGTNEYIDNSLYEISKVNIYNYQNVKNTSNDILNERIYMAEGLLKITDDTNKVFKDILEYDNILNKLSNNIDKLNNIAEIVSIAKSAEEKTNYDLDSYLLLKRTLTHENLDNLNMNFDITDRAEYVSKAMESKLSAYFNTSIDKVQEKLLDEGIEKVFKNVDKIYGADVCSFLMAYDIGTNITKLLMNNTFEAYKSELNAIYLSVTQDEIFEVAQKIYEINRQEHFTNHDNIQRLIDIYSLYDRVTIAMYENLKKADDEFKMFDKEFSNSFADFCDNSADNAYKLSLCKPEDASCSLKQFSDYYENDIFDKYIDKSNTTTPTYEGNIIDSGNCGANGDNVKWELYENGTLRIYGTGDMENYYDYDRVSPWHYKKINNVIIENGVTSIGSRAFYFSEIESAVIPDSIIKVGYRAFDETPLLEKNREGNSTIIGNGILIKYSNWNHDHEITVPEGVRVIADYVFSEQWSYTALESIVLPDSLEYIGEHAFLECKHLNNVVIPENVCYIGIGAFYGCGQLREISIPEKNMYIGGNAFGETTWLVLKQHDRSESKLIIINNNIIDGEKCEGEVIIPNNITEIPEFAFSNSDITSIVIPDTVKKIRINAFMNSKLTSVTIPKECEVIEEGAFGVCRSLQEITILNPDCEIVENSDGETISNNIKLSGSEYDGIIKGYNNSTAQEYAEKYGYKFMAIDN